LVTHVGHRTEEQASPSLSSRTYLISVHQAPNFQERSTSQGEA
jgi:hypothetical protein